MAKPQTASKRDGGYGWIIVLAFFFTQFLVDGTRFSFGVMFVELLEEFKQGKGSTAWVGSIAVGVYNLFGPIFALIVNKLGCRAASMIGAVLVTVAYVGSFFSTQLYHLYFTYGLMQGFGFGLVFLAGTVSIGQYFFEKRAFAIGLAYCGSGFGTFAFMPLVRYFIDEYTWRGTLLLIGGLALNCAVFGALHRPFVGETDEISIDVEEMKSMLSGDHNNVVVVKSCTIETSANANKNISPEEHTNGNLKNGSIEINGSIDISANENISHGISSPSKTRKATDFDRQRTFSEMRNEQFASTKQTSSIIGSHKSLNARIEHFASTKFMASSSVIGSHRSLNLSVLSHSPFGSNASFGYMVGQRGKRKPPPSVLLQQTSDAVADDTSDDDNHYSILIIEQLFPKQLVNNVNFVILMGSSFLHGISAFIPFSILPDYCKEMGGCNNSQASWLISGIGLGGIFGRIAAGWITDMPCTHRLSFQAALYLLTGFCTLLVAVFRSFELLFLYACLFGIFFEHPSRSIVLFLGSIVIFRGSLILAIELGAGGTYIVQPVVLLDYFGEEFIAEILGISMSMYGISNLIGSPIAGWLFDGTGDYRLSFLFAGSLFTIAGVVVLFVLCTKSSRDARRQLKQAKVEQNGAV